ncbi:MAG: hypothetical protein KDA79_14100 [Planctomycetaceae bacterium]|nr:hypothetical protein [Planctomycetaceae bacterium]
MNHRTPSLKQLLSGVVLTAAGTGFLLSGCAHGPSRSFQAIWEPDGAIRRAAARIASFGRTEDGPRTELVAEGNGQNSETVSRENARAVAFNPLKDPFLNDPLRASSTGYPGRPAEAVAASEKPRNPFEAISTRDTTAERPSVSQVAVTGSARNDAPGQSQGDSRFAGGFDSQLDRLRHSLRNDLNSTSPAEEIDNARIARMRIDTMMQQARQQISNGQLEAALGTVEAANRLAEKDVVFFGPNEIRPTDMLRDIREQLEARTLAAATGGLPAAGTDSVDFAAGSTVTPLLPRQGQWAGTARSQETAASPQEPEQAPEPELTPEAETESELSFRPASDFMEDTVNVSSNSQKPPQNSRDDLPPASSGSVQETASETAASTRGGGPVESDSTPAAAEQENHRPLLRIPQTESRTKPTGQGNTPATGSPQPTAVARTDQPTRLLSRSKPAAAPAAVKTAVEETAAQNATPRKITPQNTAAETTEVAVVDSEAPAVTGPTATAPTVEPGLGWSLWEGNRPPRPVARAVPAMPAHLGWKPAVEPQKAAIQPAHGDGANAVTASTRAEATNGASQLQPLSAEMADSQPLSRITAPTPLHVEGAARLEAETSMAIAGTTSPKTVADGVATDHSSAALPPGPLPEIFNVKTISQEEAQADARNRKKAALPSGLVIGVLLSLVAVAIGWHRLATWFRGRGRTMA